MQFTSPLLRGTLLKRYKRFFADILLDSGEQITAHCPNTGAMTGCAEPGYTVWVSPSDNPKRKLKFTWELAVTHKGEWISVNTHRANKLVQTALETFSITEISDYTDVKREVSPAGFHSRFDFCVTRHDDSPLYIEVKSVTLAQDDKGYFPDAVTSRGTKHAQELAALAEEGVATCLLFCVQHTGIKSVQLAEHIDAKYAAAVRDAAQRGVRVFAVGCQISEEKININQSLPVFL
ncbi:DNA/RNA nuclease SfsA [Alteromonas lipolytica]|uniref:Sugar fermentation stimulation protein homolog n=1 Tax=Alteromonas lipolytica TaxID=1856405 RepID=A0A1E8FJK7_9ALTE|nr:DNA/RNA nuclease SfsA [Alteromonas lipolytica]OFI36129.1 sugar fermentation stimulation protein SfsA [Alteromonas lipolytica]GGF86172.1 sugar fermentation stimulation protein [Alteromonas lipolytica]